MTAEKKSRTWVKDLLVAFAATTLSIILTFGTTGVINRVKQKQERKLTALMVMSSIEKFARELDVIVEDLARKDSIATWLLSIPIEEVAELGDFFMDPLRETAGNYIVLARDKSADAIFSSSIETWKNLGCFAFIENVGYAFSEMDDLIKSYSEHISNFQSTHEDIVLHPDDHPGSSNAEKYLRYDLFREQFRKLYNYLELELSLTSADLRRRNSNNMRYIGISEKEVMAFTDNLGVGTAEEIEEDDLMPDDYKRPTPDVDSLAIHLSYARQLDSLRQMKHGAGK